MNAFNPAVCRCFAPSGAAPLAGDLCALSGCELASRRPGLLGRCWRALRDALSRQRASDQAFRVLDGLSDRSLADLGIQRGQVMLLAELSAREPRIEPGRIMAVASGAR